MRKLSLSTVAFIVLLCCGGEAPTPNTTQNPSSSPDAAASSAPTSEAAEAGPPKLTIDSQREGLTKQCLVKLNSPAYCDCMFEQFRDVFKGVDLSAKEASAQELMTVKQKTITNCGAKLTEEPVKQSFAATCVTGDTRKAAFCDCAWSAYRKKLELVDFLGEFEGPRFDDAKKSTAAGCKGKMPEDVAKADFIGGCTKEAPAQGKTCECAWKKLRTKGSTEDVLLGLVDLKPGDIQACKAAP